MPRRQLSIRWIARSKDGMLTLHINGGEYTYYCDYAKIERFCRILDRKCSNKGKALSIFKRESQLIESRIGSINEPV